MTRHLGVGLLAGILLATAAVDAQFGGIIRRRVEEAVRKPPSEPEPPPTTAQPSAATLGCAVDDAAMDRLLKTLEAQRAERDAALNEAAAGKTQAQYDACQTEMATGPEGQKLLEMLDLPDDATPAQRQAAMEKFGAAGAAMLKEKCGPTPAEIRSRLGQRFDDAGKQVSDCDARIQEHAYRFCQLPASEQASAQNGGLRVPGTGTNIFWIYTAAEANAYAPRCGQLMSLTDALAAQDRQRTGSQP